MISVNGAIVTVAGLFLLTLWIYLAIQRHQLAYWVGRQIQRHRWRKYCGRR